MPELMEIGPDGRLQPVGVELTSCGFGTRKPLVEIGPEGTLVAAPRRPKRKTPDAMLAHDLKAVARPPWGDPGWTMEIKFDGMRLFWQKKDGKVRLYSRTGLEYTDKYTWALDVPVPDETTLDCELVPPGEETTYGSGTPASLVLVAFDVLDAAGNDMRAHPWTVRREALEIMVQNAAPEITASRVLGTPDADLAAELMAEGAEGVMLKRMDAPYEEGKRSWNLLKYKYQATYDVVIVDMEGSCTSEERIAAGWKNLRYGLYRGGELVVIGNTGFTGPPDELRQYIGKVAEMKGYGQSATTGAIRHPGIIGWRDDKRPTDCEWPTEGDHA